MYIKKIILGLIIIILGIGIFLCSNNYSKKENTLNDFENNNVAKKNFAILIQTDEDVYVEADEFPNDMVLNIELSACLNNNGDKVDGIISYDSNTKTLKMKSTLSLYCYLYFDKAE